MARRKSRRRRSKNRRSRRGGKRRTRRSKRSKRSRRRSSRRGGLGMHALPLSLFALQRLAMSRHTKKSGKKSRRR